MVSSPDWPTVEGEAGGGHSLLGCVITCLEISDAHEPQLSTRLSHGKHSFCKSCCDTLKQFEVGWCTPPNVNGFGISVAVGRAIAFGFGTMCGPFRCVHKASQDRDVKYVGVLLVCSFHVA